VTELEFAEKYRAMSSRDTRFDGQFITGVVSTGIYCRPSCPAMTPHAKNVRFFRTAAAAHEAGLRACKRCLPDAVPGSPDWNIRDDVAARAMRLITDGVVEREGVDGLSRRLGYSSRHLSRVLVAELGAGPLALSRAHRASTARALLVSTDLPVADIAFAAGFSSIRQFNETIAAVYELTPTAIRRSARGGAVAGRGGAVAAHGTHTGARVELRPEAPAAEGGVSSVTLRLPARPPFDGAGIMHYLASHAMRGVESGDGERFTRGIRLPGGVATVDIALDTGADGEATGVRCTAQLASLSDLPPLVARVRRLFDLDADSVAIDAALGSDPVLAPLVARVSGIRLPGSVDAFETLVRTMVGQQISIAAAGTVLGRLAAEVSGDPRVFPTAEEIATRGMDALHGPQRRTSAILGVAERFASGDIRIDVGMPLAELRATLLALPGVGEWTAGYVAMRVLGAPDVLLSTDLVLRAAAERLGLPKDPRPLSEAGERWAPWRSYAGMHIWRSSTMER
jgi:AraC family transcriptional regulator of adaptative response / DNA-3-methyladenine glycosylase II